MEIGNNLIEVRAATIEDSEAIFILANQLHETVSVVKTDFDLVFAVILRRKESLCLVATVSSIVVGYVSASIHPVLIQGGNSAYIDEIVVGIDSRGQRIGCKLMAKMEDWAKEQNCRIIGLATGGASSFYKHLDYESRAGYFKKYL